MQEKTKAKPNDLWAKLFIVGIAVCILDSFGRQGAYPAAFVLSNAIPAIYHGTAAWFAELGVFCPIAVLIVLFVLDGIVSRRR